MAKLFPLLHVTAGIFLTYAALVALFNTRRFRVGAGTVAYSSGPIPVRGGFAMPIEAVDAFAVEEKAPDSGRAVFRVVANLASGISKQVDIGTNDGASARYAADRLTTALARAKQQEQRPYRG